MAFTLTINSVSNNLGTLQINVQYSDEQTGYAASKTYIYDKVSDMKLSDIRNNILADANNIKQAQTASSNLQNLVGTVISI